MPIGEKADYMDSRYTIANFVEALRSPAKFMNEIQRVSNQTIGKALFHLKYGEGDDIMEEDWDNLILLDACRYDVFERVNYLDGDLEHRISKASQSEEFCEEYFEGETFHDSVYVTANAYGAQVSQNTFHDITVTFGEDYRGGHTEGRAPETVKEAAIEAYETHPNKRIIVHFMQPHGPYIGPKADDLRARLRDEGIEFFAWDRSDERTDRDGAIGNLMHAAQRGYITRDEFREVYIENLEIILEHVEDIIDIFDGKTVVSSDHGELLGEEKILAPRSYSHPKRTYARELRKVPWLIVNSENRREITEDPSIGEVSATESEIEAHLSALGYKG